MFFFNVDAQRFALLEFSNPMHFSDYQHVFDVKLEIFIMTDLFFLTESVSFILGVLLDLMPEDCANGESLEYPRFSGAGGSPL